MSCVVCDKEGSVLVYACAAHAVEVINSIKRSQDLSLQCAELMKQNRILQAKVDQLEKQQKKR